MPSAVSTLLSSLMHPTSPAVGSALRLIQQPNTLTLALGHEQTHCNLQKQAGGPGAVSWSPSSHGSDEGKHKTLLGCQCLGSLSSYP